MSSPGTLGRSRGFRSGPVPRLILRHTRVYMHVYASECTDVRVRTYTSVVETD